VVTTGFNFIIYAAYLGKTRQSLTILLGHTIVVWEMSIN